MPKGNKSFDRTDFIKITRLEQIEESDLADMLDNKIPLYILKYSEAKKFKDHPHYKRQRRVSLTEHQNLYK